MLPVFSTDLRPFGCGYAANFGEVEWNDFGAARPTPAKTGRTTKGQTYPIDEAKQKSAVYQAVTDGFGSPFEAGTNSRPS
jgi:hypothetical protein